jgi:GGDEF domain-containing protein
VAEKIRTTLEKPFLLNYQQEGKTAMAVNHICTTSIGVVVFDHQEGSQDDILKWADAAMYQAKQAGGNLIRHHPLHP